VVFDSTTGVCHPFLFELCGTLHATYPETAATPGRTLGVIVIGQFLVGVALAVRLRAPSSLP
jgi:hypothetical protein